MLGLFLEYAQLLARLQRTETAQVHEGAEVQLLLWRMQLHVVVVGRGLRYQKMGMRVVLRLVQVVIVMRVGLQLRMVMICGRL